MGRERTEGVEGQRREGRPKTIRRPLVGCRGGEWRLRPEASMCAPRGGREKQHGGTDRWGGAERNEHAE